MKRLSEEFNQVFLLICKFETAIEKHSFKDKPELEEDLYKLAYRCRNKILDKIEGKNLKKSPPIMVYRIATEPVSLFFACRRTVYRLAGLAHNTDMALKVTNILEGGDTYNEIHEAIIKENQSDN